MNIEYLEENLRKLGLLMNNENYYIDLGKRVAASYQKEFTASIINHMECIHGSTIHNTRLNIQNFPIFDQKFLTFHDEYKLYLNQNSYVIVNLKGEVVELVINHKQVLLSKVLYFEDLNDYLKNKIKVTIHQDFRWDLFIPSLIYQYAYLLLEKNAIQDIDYARAGMFKNAYFDILEISKYLLDANLHR